MPSDSAGLVTPPSDSPDGGLTLGGGGATSGGLSGGATPSPDKKRKYLIGGAIGAIVLVGYVILKKRSASGSGSAAGTSAAIPTLVAPASNQDTTDASLFSTLQNSIDQQGSGFSTALANLKSTYDQEIAALQNATPTTGQQTPAPANTSAPPSAALPGAPTNVGIGNSIIGNIVATIDEGLGKVVYVTSHGFVYTEGGAQYYGGTNHGSIGGTYGENIASAVATKDGGYTLVNTTGQTYNFGPNAVNPTPGPMVGV